MTKVICTAGLPGAGKGVFVKAANEVGVPAFIMGDVIREEAKKMFGRDDAKHTGILMERLRLQYGKDIVAKLTYENVVKNIKDPEFILIDGLRNPEELDFFKKKFDHVILIAVLATLKTRFHRLINRGRVDDVKSLEEFLERENREIQVGLFKLINLADYYFINENITEAEGVSKAKYLLNKIIRGLI